MLFFIICAAFALFPEKVIDGASGGVALCINAVIPSLLPFMLLSSCLIKSNFSRPLGCMLSKLLSPLTGLSRNGCVCLLTGLIGGYGTGAHAIYNSYHNGQISKAEGECLLAFCNNAGPLFVIGTVGISFFSDITAGITLYAVHVITAIICASIFRYRGDRQLPLSMHDEWIYYKKNKPSLGRLVSECGLSAVCAMGSVCVFVITFCAIINLLPLKNHGFAAGLIEITNGLRELSRGGAPMLPLAAALLSWGGLSVHFQASALCRGKLSMKKYYIGRSVSALISYLLAYLAYTDIYILALVLIATATVMICAGVIRIYKEQLRQHGFRQRQRS